MVLFAVALCGHWAAGSASPPCACSLVFGQWQTCPAWTGFSLLCWPLKQTLHKHGSACFPACMLHCELPVWLSQSLVACKDQNTGMEDDLGVLQAASPSYLHFFFLEWLDLSKSSAQLFFHFPLEPRTETSMQYISLGDSPDGALLAVEAQIQRQHRFSWLLITELSLKIPKFWLSWVLPCAWSLPVVPGIAKTEGGQISPCCPYNSSPPRLLWSLNAATNTEHRWSHW